MKHNIWSCSCENCHRAEQKDSPLFMMHDGLVQLCKDCYHREIEKKVMRGLKRQDTKVLARHQIYYNYLREHEGLEGNRQAISNKKISAEKIEVSHR